MIPKITNDYMTMSGARVTGVPILVPSLKVRKNKLVFPVLCGDKEYMCIVYGRTALRLCHHINIGKPIEVYGKEVVGLKRPHVLVHTITMLDVMAQEATFTVEKAKIWDYLSKVPVISRWVPEAMKL